MRASPTAIPASHPAELTSFVGRSRELREVERALAGTRLLTLTGAGGVGKTRLALRLCAENRSRSRDRSIWVELASISDRELIAAEIARVLAIRCRPGEAELDACARFLAPRATLIALDNCEHLTDGCGTVVEELLRACPEIAIVVTSQEPLRVPGELEWRVPPLSLPGSNGAERESDALALFTERARLVQPGFELTEETAQAAGEICRSLDGIPLAIELAAARLRHLSCRQIAEGLTDRFRLLTGGQRSALPRHRTLRASVEWSHALLTDAERTLLRRLAVFVDGFTLEAAEAVAEGDGLGADEILDLLASLVDKSLVQTERQERDVRYRLLEMIRQFAMERLAEAEEVGAIRNRQRDRAIDLVDSVSDDLFTPRQAEILDLLDREAGNLDAAIEWSAATNPPLALHLCLALGVWWQTRGQFAAGDAAYERALDAHSKAAGGEELRVMATAERAYLLAFAGDVHRAIGLAEQAIDDASALDLRSTMPRALSALGMAYFTTDPATAYGYLDRAIEAAREFGDDWARLRASVALGYACYFEGEPERMGEALGEAESIAVRIGSLESLAWIWIGSGLARYSVGEHQVAGELIARGVDAARNAGEPNSEALGGAYLCQIRTDLGDPGGALADWLPLRKRARERGAGLALTPLELAGAYAELASGERDRALALLNDLPNTPGPVLYSAIQAELLRAELSRLTGKLDDASALAAGVVESARALKNERLTARAHLIQGRLAASRREWSEAERLHQEALAMIVKRNCRLELPGALEALAEVTAGLDSHEEAARILGAAARVREETGFVAWRHQREELEALRGQVREALGPEPYAVAHAEGAALETEEAIAWLRRARGERKRPSGGWESLTPTELEVARHAAAGLTNPQIAERMFVSRATVKTHLSHIYRKLEVSGRAELAREAAGRLEAPHQA